MSFAMAQIGGAKKGSGPFCAKHPKGRSGKRVLTPFSSSRPVAGARGSDRRGTVLIMVVGVLAMLFIVGSTLIIVARFERQTSDKLTAGQNMDAILQAVMEPIKSQLREDVVGDNDIPYDRAWTPSETSKIEDTADFPGVAGTASDEAERMRSGDLLLSSGEPVMNTSTTWIYPWMSSGLDAVPTGYTANLSTILNLPVDQTHGPLTRDARGYAFDSDGDGLRDMGNSGILAQTANMFGPGYMVGQRVVPHGGMVLIDPFTHPMLMAQVIHPEDTIYHNDPMQLWADPALTLSTSDEGGLRRRNILPANVGTDTPGNLLVANTDLRAKLPVTTGYKAPSAADQRIVQDLTPHWWPVDNSVVDNDDKWWKAILTPPAFGPSETGYASIRSKDTYSRRQLITTANSDDLLRVNRDENRLANPELEEFLLNPSDPASRAVFAEVTAPQAAASTDIGNPATLLPVPPLPLPDSLLFKLVGINSSTYVPGASLFVDISPSVGSLTRQFFDYGRDETGALQFNVDGLRTRFSLRDVLDPYTGQGTYQKAVQLTAYFLAMMQHTSWPGSDADPTTVLAAAQVEQLQAAAQLAVNVIDYADYDGDVDGDGIEDQVSTYFAWPPSTDPTSDYWPYGLNKYPDNLRVRVYGVEKQPFITEAYVKLIIKPEPSGGNQKWDGSTSVDAESIYAVELYNPYPVPLSLRGYKISGALTAADLGIHLKTDYPTAFPDSTLSGYIKRYSYLVIANRTMDASQDSAHPELGYDPFIMGANISGDPNTDLFVDGELIIRPETNVGLGRTEQRILELRPDGFVFPATSGLSFDELDQLAYKAKDMVTPENRWADHVVDIDQDGKAQQADLDGLGYQPGGIATARLVRDTSLQRQKEFTESPLNSKQYPPIDWHCTLAVQGQYPLRDYESWFFDGTNPSPTGGAGFLEGYPLSYNNERPPQHNLLGKRPVPGAPLTDPGIQVANIRLSNQDLLEAEFLGKGWGLTGNLYPFSGKYSDPDWPVAGTNRDIKVSTSGGNPIASFPIVTADRGIDRLTGGTLAFPTTGSLLLVTRYAHQKLMDAGAGWSEYGVPTLARIVPASVTGSRTIRQQLEMLDNGHIPVFDNLQYTRDMRDDSGDLRPDPQSRLDAPWGQLIYEYFTALPLEELTRRYDFAALNAIYITKYTGYPNPGLAGLGTNTRMIDLPTDAYQKVYATLFNFNPLVEPVEAAMADKGSKLGPKVRGRINVNEASWWVLDGLPVLPMGLVDTMYAIPPIPDKKSGLPTSGVPTGEIDWTRLDPPDYLAANPPNEPAALIFMNGDASGQMGIFERGDSTATTVATKYFPSVSPKLAKYMTSYAQGQPVYDPATGTTIDAGHVVSGLAAPTPGFVTLGNLADLMLSVPLASIKTQAGTFTNADFPLTLPNLRTRPELTYLDGNGLPQRPYAYLGYLQLVAPLVRIEDWVTVKNHVFTIYATVGDTSDPQMPIWMRSQLTVDRTNCLYAAGELPQKVTETPAIAYQNAVDDK